MTQKFISLFWKASKLFRNSKKSIFDSTLPLLVEFKASKYKQWVILEVASRFQGEKLEKAFKICPLELQSPSKPILHIFPTLQTIDLN